MVEWSATWGRPGLGNQKFPGYILKRLLSWFVRCSLFAVGHLLCLVECLFAAFCFTSASIFLRYKEAQTLENNQVNR